MDRTARRSNGSPHSRGNGFRSRKSGGAGTASRPAGGGRGGRRPAPGGEFAPPATVTPALPAVEAFDELDLPERLLAALRAEGLTAPFPIQAATLPNSLAGRDVLGRGRTGSGKTLAFGLALLARVDGRRAEARQPMGLVLVPTRELAQQVTDALTPFARALRLRLTTVVGGMPIGRQANALRTGAEVVVATPGRLKDLIDRGDCRLDHVDITVLDEADQMTDMGFMPQVTALLDQVRPGGQRMLFSATLDRNVAVAADQDPGPFQGRSGHGPGGHQRRRPRHPRRQPRPGRQRGPARRPQGLPAPRRPYGTRRRIRHRRHAGPAPPAA